MLLRIIKIAIGIDKPEQEVKELKTEMKTEAKKTNKLANKLNKRIEKSVAYKIYMATPQGRESRNK